MLANLLCGFILASFAFVDEAPSVTELKAKLQGRWQLLEVETDGAKVERQAVPPIKLTVKDNAYVFEIGFNIEKGTLELTAGEKLTHIKFSITQGTDKGKTQVGVCRLDGDTFKLCVGKPGDTPGPTELVTKPDSGQIFFTFRRVK